MTKLKLEDISDLRAYERERDDFRRKIITLKKIRRIGLGPIVSVVFESRDTIRFQIQEMARAERLMSDAALEEELSAYNPLIPDTGKLCLTVFLELTSEEELREWLPKLVGLERSIVLRVGEQALETEIPGEVEETHASQLTRTDVTASVHYVHLSLDEPTQRRFYSERTVLAVKHPFYLHECVLTEELKHSIAADWTS